MKKKGLGECNTITLDLNCINLIDITAPIATHSGACYSKQVLQNC